jgi:hypothetical protein
MHVALGVRTPEFPIDRFLSAPGRVNVTIATAPRPGIHDRGSLTLSGNPHRRGGEWLIRDQYSNRHPGWSPAAGFPAIYDHANPPYALIFRVDGTFHIRFAKESTISGLAPSSIPNGMLARTIGIAAVNEAFLAALDVPSQTLLSTFDELAEQISEDFDPGSVEDGRRRVIVSILQRQGQRDFRRKLLQAYGGQCAMTRCKTEWVLEAAHITPYRGIRTNAISNGLLLRADIHTLFDLGLISIEPKRMKIRVSSRVSDSPYLALDGTNPALPRREAAWPSRLALKEHYSLFQP